MVDNVCKDMSASQCRKSSRCVKTSDKCVTTHEYCSSHTHQDACSLQKPCSWSHEASLCTVAPHAKLAAEHPNVGKNVEYLTQYCISKMTGSEWDKDNDTEKLHAYCQEDAKHKMHLLGKRSCPEPFTPWSGEE